jgi:hypothetical protein
MGKILNLGMSISSQIYSKFCREPDGFAQTPAKILYP